MTKYACEIPFGDGSDGSFNPDDWMEPKDRRKVDDFILYGMAAAVQAVRDAGWEEPSEDEKLRTGVMIGSGIGGLTSIAETAALVAAGRHARLILPRMANASATCALAEGDGAFPAENGG